MHSRSRPVPLTLPQSMTTLLLADNAIMLHGLSRYLDSKSASDRFQLHSPEWLLTGGAGDMPRHPIDFALLDCSGTDVSPGTLMEALCRRIRPRSWLVIARPDAHEWMRRAAWLGAGGCLLAPASPELVAAAVALVSAGGQCFPRAALKWLLSPAVSNFRLPGSTASG